MAYRFAAKLEGSSVELRSGWSIVWREAHRRTSDIAVAINGINGIHYEETA